MSSVREQIIEHIEGKIRTEKREHPRHKLSPPLEEIIGDMEQAVGFLKTYSFGTMVPTNIGKEILRALYEFDNAQDWDNSSFRFPMDHNDYKTLLSIHEEINRFSRDTDMFQIRTKTLIEGLLKEIEDLNKRFLEKRA